MSRLRPGWLVVLSAAILLVSAWLPWLVNPESKAGARDGGHASAVGGIVGDVPILRSGFGVGQLIVLLSSTLIVAGAMAARCLSARLASSAALAISVLIVVLVVWYYRLYVYAPLSAGWGLYLGGAMALASVLLSVWAMAAAWSSSSVRAG
jgi:hypothetical protein